MTVLVAGVKVNLLVKTVPTNPRFSEPASEKVISQAVVPQVTTPETFRVPVEMVMISRRAAVVGVVALMVSEPQVTVPAPMAMVRLNPAAGLGMVMFPLTLSVLAPLIVSVVSKPIAVQVSEVQTAAVSTVTFTPWLMVTVSAAAGTGFPPQVAVLLQLPDTLAVLAAAQTDGGQSSKARKVNRPQACRMMARGQRRDGLEFGIADFMWLDSRWLVTGLETVSGMQWGVCGGWMLVGLMMGAGEVPSTTAVPDTWTG